MTNPTQQLENEIIAKGLTAPRVTPTDIEENIYGEYYFTASQGVIASNAGNLARRFLIRPVPTDVYPDGTPGREGRTGTNLMNATQAIDMFRELVTDCNMFPALDCITFCVLVLRNGFTVTGESACASPENFDAEIGRKIARQNAVQKIWPLMGYELRSELSQ